MKIAYLIPGMYNSGGLERVITTMSDYLIDRYGCEIYIITTDQRNCDFYYPISPKVKHIDLDINFYNRKDGSVALKFIKRFYQRNLYKRKLSGELNRIKVDFTITMFSIDIDFLHTLKDGSRKIGNMQFFKDFRTHQIKVSSQNKVLHWIGNWRTRTLLENSKQLSSIVVMTKQDMEAWKGINDLVLIPNPLPFTASRLSPLKEKTAISVGRLSKEKGYDLLIEAWSIVAEKYPDWILNIYGEGPERVNLEKQIKKYNLEKNIFLKGATSDVQNKYQESSFFISSSRYEGFGIVIIEAMSCGLPVIAFDCGNGPSDIIENNIDGYLVEKGDIRALAHKVFALIENEGTKKEMSINALKKASNYSVEKIMRQWMDLFEELIQKGYKQ